MISRSYRFFLFFVFVSGLSIPLISPSALSQERFFEDFESGKKSKYSSDEVLLESGAWIFDEAMIGKDDKDSKHGIACARIRSGGKLTMNFDKINGAGKISISHASFGKDKSVRWKLSYSTNQGSNWKVAESFQSSSELSTATVQVNVPGKIRIEIESDSKGRLNIDDISITDFVSNSSQKPTSVDLERIQIVSEKPRQLPPLKDSDAKESIRTNTYEPIRTSEIHIALGIPKNPQSKNEFPIARPQYVISYNLKRNALNWASWNVNAAWYGKVERHRGKFLPDPELPKRSQVKHEDYSNGGYDRGHMVRSDERTRTAADNLTTFYMTNVLAQEADLNQGVWNDFENYCKELAINENKELYIIAGGIFDKDQPKEPIGRKLKIQVPNSTWKIVVVLNRGEGLKQVSTYTRVIAVNMPNASGVKNDRWRKYLTTVRKIENLTGYDFLTAVPKSIQDVLETKLDNE